MLVPIKIKKSKIKQKRRRIALTIILCCFLLLLYIILHAKDYEKNYQRNGFEIKEIFDKELNAYTFTISKEEKSWSFLVESKYKRRKKLIQSIELLEENETSCIILKSKKLKTYPQCIHEEQQIDFHLISDSLKEKLGESYFAKINHKNETYEKIDINTLDDHTYYIWNYKGFYRINKEKKETINIFEKDVYNLTNTISVKNYILIPDYNSSYYFNKFYVLNMKDGKTSTWDFKDSIYYDGYYLGSNNNSLFYVDKKTKTEWEFWPKKKKMRKIGTENKNGRILIDGDWEKVSMEELMNNQKKFKTKEKYQYEIEKGLYVNYINSNIRKKISNLDVKEIVSVIDNTVYYLVGDALYMYKEELGEVKLMNYFEWNFNYENMIFIN